MSNNLSHSKQCQTTQNRINIAILIKADKDNNFNSKIFRLDKRNMAKKK